MVTDHLFNVLLDFFSKGDAVLLAELLKANLHKETVRYQEIDIVESQKKDLILLAFEERILIPVKSRSGPAWEDKILDFRNEGRYFFPPIVKTVVDTICDTGEASCDTAVRNTLGDVIEKDIGSVIKLLQTTMKHSEKYIFETGLLEIFFKEAALDIDLHDIIDIFVIFGMMSPCPQKSLLTGLSWYEINSTLYWDVTFLS